MTVRAGRARSAVIVGAGVLGCSIGLALRKRGWRVTIVDALERVAEGSTGASLGILRFHASNRQTVAMSVDGHRAWAEPGPWLEDVTASKQIDFRRTGSLVLDLGTGYIDTVRRLYEQSGVAYQVLDHDQLLARFPRLRLGRYTVEGSDPEACSDQPIGQLEGGIYTPEAGYVADVPASVGAIARAFLKQGGDLLLGTSVASVARSGGRARGVWTSDGELRADAVVLALGPHSAGFLKRQGLMEDFGVRLGPLRHQMFRIPLEGDEGGMLPHIADDDLGLNIRPDGQHSLFAGIQQPPGTVGDPEGAPEIAMSDLDSRTWKEVTRRLALRLSGAVPERMEGIAGAYDVADDWFPIYDRTLLDGCYVAVGTSGTQYKTAPTVGVLMAHLVEACEGGADHDAVPVQAPMLFGGTADLGRYSRLRTSRLSQFTING